jgi:hypothetical protein
MYQAKYPHHLWLTFLLLGLQERRWFFIRNGSAKDYHGPAVHWRHLSRFERHVLRLHRQYDPVADLQQRREARMARPSYNNPLKPVTNGNANGYTNGESIQAPTAADI